AGRPRRLAFIQDGAATTAVAVREAANAAFGIVARTSQNAGPAGAAWRDVRSAGHERGGGWRVGRTVIATVIAAACAGGAVGGPLQAAPAADRHHQRNQTEFRHGPLHQAKESV